MAKIRIGKDIILRGSLTFNGEEINLVGLNLKAVATLKSDPDYHVLLGRVGGYGSNESEEETNESEMGYLKVAANGSFEIGFYGMNQEEVGKYIITLWQNYGDIGETAWDVQAFQLVQYSFKEDDDVDGLEIGIVNLGTIDFTDNLLKNIKEMYDKLDDLYKLTYELDTSMQQLGEDLRNAENVRVEAFEQHIHDVEEAAAKAEAATAEASQEAQNVRALMEALGENFAERMAELTETATNASEAAVNAVAEIKVSLEAVKTATEAANKAAEDARNDSQTLYMIVNNSVDNSKIAIDAAIEEAESKLNDAVEDAKTKIEEATGAIEGKIEDYDAKVGNIIRNAEEASSMLGYNSVESVSRKESSYESPHIKGLGIKKGEKFYVKVSCANDNHPFTLAKRSLGSTTNSTTTIYSNRDYTELVADKDIDEVYVYLNVLSTVNETVRLFVISSSLAEAMRASSAATAANDAAKTALEAASRIPNSIVGEVQNQVGTAFARMYGTWVNADNRYGVESDITTATAVVSHPRRGRYYYIGDRGKVYPTACFVYGRYLFFEFRNEIEGNLGGAVKFYVVFSDYPHEENYTFDGVFIDGVGYSDGIKKSLQDGGSENVQYKTYKVLFDKASSVTKETLDDALAAKQDVIADIDNIRDNAEEAWSMANNAVTYIGPLPALQTTVKTNVVFAINSIQSVVGNKAKLDETVKADTLVEAINKAAKLGGGTASFDVATSTEIEAIFNETT